MDKFLTIKEVADLTRSSLSLIYRMVRDGELVSVRMGGKILIPEEPLKAKLAGSGENGTVAGSGQDQEPVEIRNPPETVDQKGRRKKSRGKRKKGTQLW